MSQRTDVRVVHLLMSELTEWTVTHEVFGFLGLNGAGKPTTIHIFLDFVRRISGDVSIVGHDLQEDPRAIRDRDEAFQ